MPASHEGPFVLRTMLWSLFTCLLLTCNLTYATSQAFQVRGPAENGTTPAASDVQGLVAAAQAAMAHANALITKHPRPNHYETESPEHKEAAKIEADPLSLSGYKSSNSSNGPNVGRRASSNDTLAIDSGQEAHSYTIPSNVAEAAVDAAGIGSKTSSADSYDSVIAELQAKFKPKINDTNRMAQRMQTYSGLMAGIVAPGHGFELGTTDTTHNSTLKRRQWDNTTTPGGSDSTTFWMETIKHLGAVPGASSGYKVWRSVKDYGAVGDGVTDDTTAIQKAMADGERGHDSVLPATLYFPSGTYLVSSPIIHLAHTEIIGNPQSLPRLVAASSFVGLGLITSEAFAKQGSAWFLDSGSQQRSARNLIIDIRAAPQDAYVSGIHWQTGRGCSLENVHFYMSQAQDTTQLGLFVENGRGGSLSDLFFVGGRFGMLVGQQQFAADGLYFSKCQTAVQMVWDWGLSLQNLVVSDCGTGVDVVESFEVSLPDAPRNNNVTVGGGITNRTSISSRAANNKSVAGSSSSSWWHLRLHRRRNDSSSAPDDATSSKSRAGSFSLVDMFFANTKVAINAALSTDSTSLLVLNSAFSNVGTAIHNSNSGTDLLAGGASNIDAWAFGKVYDRSTASFKIVKGETLSASSSPPKRNTSLTISSGSSAADMSQPLFFHRRRPSYASIDLRSTQIINVKDLGAKGDGTSDDTGILNKLLDMAANMSAVTYFPYGSYVISDTLDVPIGSRIVGEAWAQIVASSSTAFGDVEKTRAAVRVGQRVSGLKGDIGVVEIQGLTVTTRGKADGAVLMEWNARQVNESQGSVGLWDTQFRVGDATVEKGSPASAALMLHLRPGSSAYLDNIGLGPDVDDSAATSVSARGLLVESRGPSWLWGMSSVNNAVYQFGFSRAENVVAGQLIMSTSAVSSSLGGMVQKMVETAPFAGDPAPDSKTALTGVRISNSQGIQILSAGDLDSGSSLALLEIDQSHTVTIQNANRAVGDNMDTGSSSVIISPANDEPSSVMNVTRRQAGNTTAPSDNSNGRTASILSVTDITTTAVTYNPYVLWTQEDLDGTNATDSCKAVLTSNINCPNNTLDWSTQPMYHGSLNNTDLTTAVCASICKDSLTSYISRAESACKGFLFSSGMSPTLPAYYILYGVSETCSKDTATGKYCNDVIANFTISNSLDQMPKSELCSNCYTARLKMMQASPYSIYRLATFYQRALKKAVTTCPLDSSTPTNSQPAPIPSAPGTNVCIATRYTAKAGDDCNSIALANSVSSAGLLNSNKNLPSIVNCTSIAAGMDMCLPLKCTTYTLKDNDTCSDVAYSHGIVTDNLLRYNSWIDPTCSNLAAARPILGRVVCLSPPGGAFNPPNGTTGGGGSGGGTGQGSGGTGYSTTLASPPANAPVAARTTRNCGVWHVAQVGDTCEAMTIAQGLAKELLLETNPSLRGSNCTAQLKAGTAYCVSPLQSWDRVVSFPYKELGCYGLTGNSSRVLWDSYARDATGMTVEECAADCLLVGYPFFGLQNGDGCYCDNTLTKGSTQGSGKCGVKCVGNATETCGGSDASNYMDVWGWPTVVTIASS